MSQNNSVAANNNSVPILNWFLDPEYFLFERCQCDSRLLPQWVEFNNLMLLTCVTPPSETLAWFHQYPWILALIAIVGCALVGLFIWFFFFRRGSRPPFVQRILDLRKRMKGLPTSGTISIVVTDIEGFSDLMGRSPFLMMPALLIHNNLITKAKHTNFGYVVEQEGDSYSIAFEEAADAVRFCLQTQILLSKQTWPEVRASPLTSSLFSLSC